MTCCDDTAVFVFRITSPLTKEVITFLPNDLGGLPARWNQFEIMLVDDSLNIDLDLGHILITKSGTWDYEILWVSPDSPIDLDNLTILGIVETGMMQIHDITSIPAWSPVTQVTPAY